MSWERDPLWAKARLFFGRAVNTPRDDPTFGLWCSLGLELLARAALASVSPTLLAQPDPAQRNLLHVVHRESEIPFPKSISASVVFDLCRKIFPAFSKEDRKVASALLHLRNEEVHSGAAAFDQYSPSHWLIGFYHACQSLSTVLGETLAELFGEDEAKFAERLLAENRDNLRNTVLTAIAAYKKVFSTRDPGEQKALRAQAEELAGELSAKRHHRVVCPSCGCTATLQGTPFGKEHVTHEEEGAIVVRQAVSPTDFSCSACGLKLSTYAEVETAGLGEHYTRTTTYSPEDYYGLINPDDLDSYLASQAEDVLEFDNE
jgi:hypothetical protein